jgi:hypothetical protein
MNREVKDLIKEAEGQGWVVEPTKNHHYKWLSPLGGFFFSSSTPSDHRALQNIKRDLRVRGFVTITRKERRKR